MQKPDSVWIVKNAYTCKVTGLTLAFEIWCLQVCKMETIFLHLLAPCGRRNKNPKYKMLIQNMRRGLQQLLPRGICVFEVWGRHVTHLSLNWDFAEGSGDMAQLGGFPLLKLQVCDMPIPARMCHTALHISNCLCFWSTASDNKHNWWAETVSAEIIYVICDIRVPKSMLQAFILWERMFYLEQKNAFYLLVPGVFVPSVVIIHVKRYILCKIRFLLEARDTTSGNKITSKVFL